MLDSEMQASKEAGGNLCTIFPVKGGRRTRKPADDTRREEELRACKQIIAVAAELAQLGTWEYDAERKLFIFSDEFYRIYGTSAEQEGRLMAPEVYIQEFVHPADAVMVQTVMKSNVAAGRNHVWEHRIIRRDGAVRNIRVWVSLKKDAAGNIVKLYGVTQDVTEQKALEEELRSTKENLSLALELAHLGPWIYHVEKNLFEFNDEFYAIYGTTVAREGRFMTPEVYVREFIHPDDVGIVTDSLQLASSFPDSCCSFQLEHRIIRRDGLVRTIRIWKGISRDEHGSIINFYGINQDITERIVSEDALRASEDRHNATLKAIPDTLLRTNAEGKLLDYRIAEGFFDSLIRKSDNYNTLSDLLPTSLAQAAKKLIGSSLLTGKTKMMNFSGPIGDSECSVEIRAAAINASEALVIIRDQIELYRVQREVQRLDSLNLIGEMAANIGHEVRNPLTTVRGYLQFLKSKEQFKGHSETFQVMIGELDRANAIITEFLALSKNKAIILKPLNINRIITTIYPLLEVDSLAESKSIQLELADNIQEIFADEGEIRQLLINLVRNGLEAMNPNGHLTIRTAIDGEHVDMRVRDEGPGISDSIAMKIGLPFFTTKEHGTGLGLSICYSIAARHGAVIDYTTSKNGTEFVVRFKVIQKNDCNNVEL